MNHRNVAKDRVMSRRRRFCTEQNKRHQLTLSSARSADVVGKTYHGQEVLGLANSQL